MKRRIAVVIALLAGLAGLAVMGTSFTLIGAPPPGKAANTRKAIFTEQSLSRGAYLARAGNCVGCHTAQSGPAYAGA